MYNRKYNYLILSGLALDIVTKYFFNLTLNLYDKITIIPKILAFQLVHNYGAAYGIFQNQKLFLISTSIIVMVVVFKYRESLGTNQITKLAYSFLMIGTIGNLIDRAIRGYVVDFINIHIIPVFNIADIAINLCIYCLIIDYIKNRNEKNI